MCRFSFSEPTEIDRTICVGCILDMCDCVLVIRPFGSRVHMHVLWLEHTNGRPTNRRKQQQQQRCIKWREKESTFWAIECWAHTEFHRKVLKEEKGKSNTRVVTRFRVPFVLFRQSLDSNVASVSTSVATFHLFFFFILYLDRFQ